MAPFPAPLLRPDDRLLLAQHGAGGLPSPVALQLLDVPFVLPLQQQPARADGQLPESAWRVETELTATDRTRYRVRVTGDPYLGLPYGRDGDVLLALFRILDEGRDVHDLATGTLQNPNYHMICRALGLEATGPLVQRIRDALRRLANVRIESRLLVDRSAEATRVLAHDGSALPTAATGGTVRRHEVEESRWLLEYRTEARTVEDRTAPEDARSSAAPTDVTSVGDDPDSPARRVRRARVERTFWIHELRVNPFWVSQAISGWAGWIDVERHAALQSITARRLYQICAAHAARNLRVPWAFSERELFAACLLSTDGRKPTRLRQQLTEAAQELTEAGVLSEYAWHGAPRRGGMEFTLGPGPLLRVGELLRGIGLTDPPDVRVQYALLRAFGVSAPKARALIAAKPGQVAEVLLRACHLRATDPGAVNKSWAGWIVYHVEQDTDFAGEVAFQQWRRTELAAAERSVERASSGVAGGATGATTGAARRLRAGHADHERPAPENRGRMTPDAGPAATSSPALPDVDAWAVVRGGRPTEDPDAAARWERVRAALYPTLASFDRYWVDQVVPMGSATDELVLCVPDGLTEIGLQRLLPRIRDSVTADGGEDVAVRVALAPRPSASRSRPHRSGGNPGNEAPEAPLDGPPRD